MALALAVATTACGTAAASRPDTRGTVALTVIRVTATPQGCPPRPARVRAGSAEVLVTNLDAATVSEVEIRSNDLSRVLGEKENLIEGMSASFSIDLAPGRYIVNCPGATEPHWSLVAMPTQATAP